MTMLNENTLHLSLNKMLPCLVVDQDYSIKEACPVEQLSTHYRQSDVAMIVSSQQGLSQQSPRHSCGSRNPGADCNSSELLR